MNFILGFIFLSVLSLVLLSLKTDDSDKSFFKRSGASIVTDYKTGLQYLETRGGLTPRLDENGKQMKVK